MGRSARPDGRILLLVTSSSYRAGPFLAAAERLGVRTLVGSDHRNALEGEVPAATVRLDLDDLEASRTRVEALHARDPIAAVVAAEDEGVVLAAELAAALGVRGHPPSAAAACRRKDLFRAALAGLDIPSPWFLTFPIEADPAEVAGRVDFPCVVKPLSLSASRGVLRADDAASFAEAFRVSAGIADAAGRTDGAETGGRRGGTRLLVEGYIPGEEVALEGLLIDGRLRVLALLDKPDPLVGPTFEETMFVTPSRHPPALQRLVAGTVQRVARHLGLRDGAVHAELRIHGDRAWPIELAPRTIGGQCARLFEIRTGTALEELVLLAALGRDVPDPPPRRASGALMIPTPRTGVFVRLDGVEEARAVPGIEDVTLSVHPGQRVETLPRGHRYLGFAFARAKDPAGVEAALREAGRRLRPRIEEDE